MQSESSQHTVSAPLADTSRPVSGMLSPTNAPDLGPRIVLIDNQDSFTHLLADLVFRAVGIMPSIIANTAPLPPADLYILSPGPGHPADDLGCSRAALSSGVPVLGVCLGHQLIAYEAGALVARAQKPMHGLTSKVFHDGGLGSDVASPIEVIRYHSLDVRLPADTEVPLEVLATAEDGTIMALRHRDLPQWGVQFHPESIGTQQGEAMLRHFIVQALNPLQWAQEYAFFAWLEFDGVTRIAAGDEPVAWDEPGLRYGAISYEATALIDGSLTITDTHTESGCSPTVMFRPQRQLIIPGVLPQPVQQLSAAASAASTQNGAGDVADENAAVSLTVVPRHSSKQYMELVEQCKEYIADGLSYELCLTTSASCDLTPLRLDGKRGTIVQLYQALRAVAPAPMAGLLLSDEVALLSASPERFVAAEQGVLRAEPMKGTRPRSDDPVQDAALRLELEQSTKDRAENIMIVDVLRNDLLRSCLPGTVQAPKVAEVSTFARSHQMISTITGTLRQPCHMPPGEGTQDASVLAAAALRAFPGGSMTGAPKQRSMELLAGLEQQPRGMYSGCLGFIDDANGCMDFSMLIRSIELRGNIARYGAGGAVTRLSDAQEEFDEVQVKLLPFTLWCAAIAAQFQPDSSPHMPKQ